MEMPPKLPVWAYIAWTVSLAAVVASIYFIEILGNPAASLCWIERMMMLGVFLVISVGIVRRDQSFKVYSWPFILIGLPVALFQQLVHWGIIDLSTQSCTSGVVCTAKFFNLFGFISQATLCLVAFIIIAFCLRRSGRPTANR